MESSDQCPGEHSNKIHFPCSDSCGCCVDGTRCPSSWIDDGECDVPCFKEEFQFDGEDCRGEDPQDHVRNACPEKWRGDARLLLFLLRAFACAVL